MQKYLIKPFFLGLVLLSSKGHALDLSVSGSLSVETNAQVVNEYLMSPTAIPTEGGAPVELNLKRDRSASLLKLFIKSRPTLEDKNLEINIQARCDVFENTESLGHFSVSRIGSLKLGLVKSGVIEARASRIIRANCVNEQTSANFSLYINNNKNQNYAIMSDQKNSSYSLITF